MKAIIATKYGPPEVLQIQNIPKPTPKDKEVLIKIHATTVHVGDTRMRRFDVPLVGWLPARLILGIMGPKKHILGMECAGEVEAVGKNVTRFKQGDKVFAATLWNYSSYAEYVCLPEDLELLEIMPANTTFEEAAPIPSGALTALWLLRGANLQQGQHILIYGASGSVGTYAVQLAKHHFGAKVTGVCSTSNVDMVKSLGADEVIDYKKDDFTQNGQTYDVVFDAVDKLPSTKAKKSLASKGIYRNVGKGPSPKTPDDLRLLKQLVEEGKLKAVIDRTYPMEQIVEAHRYVDKGHKKGNVVITVGEST